MRPKTLAEVAQLTLAGDSFDRCLANFLDEFHAAPNEKPLADVPPLLSEKFGESGRVQDAYLAATAEELARTQNLSSPTWVDAEAHKLHRPWFASPLAAQFSAAIADAIGCGGMVEDVSKKRVSEDWAYAGVAIIGIAITWLANVFEIIALASRAFALYYVLQCSVATVFAWSAGRRAKAGCFAALGALGILIVLFGRSVE